MDEEYHHYGGKSNTEGRPGTDLIGNPKDIGREAPARSPAEFVQRSALDAPAELDDDRHVPLLFRSNHETIMAIPTATATDVESRLRSEQRKKPHSGEVTAGS
jgi:hypothetical protein